MELYDGSSAGQEKKSPDKTLVIPASRNSVPDSRTVSRSCGTDASLMSSAAFGNAYAATILATAAMYV